MIRELKEKNDFLSTTSVNTFELFRGIIKSNNINSIEIVIGNEINNRKF